MSPQIQLGKEVYLDKKAGKICYGEAYITNSNRKVSYRDSIDVTEKILLLAAMYLLEQKEDFNFNIAKKGSFKLSIEKNKETK